MNYDAVAVSANDLTAGAIFFKQYQDGTIPWVSANIIDKNDEVHFPGHIVKDVGSLTVGIIGLTGGGKNPPVGFIIGEWQSALDKEVQLLDNLCDILIVLSNLPDGENQKVIMNFPQVDLLVSTSPRSGNMKPRISGNCLMTQSGSRGKYIGKLEIEWNSGGQWQTDNTEALTLLHRRIRSIDRQIHQLEQNEKKQPGKDKNKLERMKVYQRTVSEQIEGMTKQLAASSTVAANKFKSAFLPVRPSIHPAAMQQIVQEIKQSIRSLNMSRKNDIKKDDKLARQPLQLETIGNFNQCRTCHPDQVTFWQDTEHARAYVTLESRGQSYNLDCLPCHVTGGSVDYNSPERDKLLLLTLPNHRKNIGCGSCHGKTAQHLLSPDSEPPISSFAKELCTGCHTTDRDSNFVFETKLSLIRCPPSKL